MSSKSAAGIRMDLARGHVVLGEHAEALVCLERAVREEPGAPGLLAVIEELLEVWGMDRARSSFRAAAEALRAQLIRASSAAPAAAQEPDSTGELAEEPSTEPELEASLVAEDDVALLEAEPLSEESFADLNLPVAVRRAPAFGAPRPPLPAAGFDEGLLDEVDAEPLDAEPPPVQRELPTPRRPPPRAAPEDGRVRVLERWLMNVRESRSRI